MSELQLPETGKVLCLDAASIRTKQGPSIIFIALDARNLEIVHYDLFPMEQEGSYLQFILALNKHLNLESEKETYLIMAAEESDREQIEGSLPFPCTLIPDGDLCRKLCETAWLYIASAMGQKGE